MSILTAFPGINVRWCIFLLFTLFGPFFSEIDHHIFLHTEFVSIWLPCPVVLRHQGNDAGVSGLLFSDFLWFLFSPQRPTHPKPGYLFDAKRTNRGWPKPYGFFLGFLSTIHLCIYVYLSFVLFCSFFVSEINWNWNCSKALYIP